MSASLESTITAAILGDAAGYTLEGFKNTHIQALFREPAVYPDMSDVMKHGLEKWRKPGLYSSITQLLLLSCACTGHRHFNKKKFIETVKDSPELPHSEFSYFRNPGAAEKNFITGAMDEKIPESARFDRPCSRIIPISLSLLMTGLPAEEIVMPVIEYVSLYTYDISTAVCSAILNVLMCGASGGKSASLLPDAETAADIVLKKVRDEQHQLFSSGYNPDYVINEAERMKILLSRLRALKEPDHAERIICDETNRMLKTPVTRGSVNLPGLILPFAISIAALSPDPCDVALIAASQGGSASSLASVAAAVRSKTDPDPWHPELAENLVNKKRIISIISDITSRKNLQQAIDDIKLYEPQLSNKEHEEFLAKNKKSGKSKPSKPEKNRKQAEEVLSKHVVESWTKTDKARWKKEKKRKDAD